MIMGTFNQDELEQVAIDHAKAHDLDPALVCAVIEQESEWNTYAYRYEPAFYARYVTPLDLQPTESIGRSTSWGLMQLMGEVARELGYKGDIPKLCYPDIGVDWGCLHLANKVKQHPGDLNAALQAWNGGGNPNYATEVLARVDKYKVTSSDPQVLQSPDLSTQV